MSCLFCKIVTGEIRATILFEDNDIIAFPDINPQAPSHLLIIPKRHIATINDIVPTDQQLIGKMVLIAKQLAHQAGQSLAGYRLVFNVNADGGQAVYHIHLHLLGGRQMIWPPG
jgi:histidine triad (HIT) family protein